MKFQIQDIYCSEIKEIIKIECFVKGRQMEIDNDMDNVNFTPYKIAPKHIRAPIVNSNGKFLFFEEVLLLGQRKFILSISKHDKDSLRLSGVIAK